MGSGGFPADGPLEAELTALRERAYGVDADIGADPVAVARLTELEELHAASANAAAAADAAPSPDPGASGGPAGGHLGEPGGRRPRQWRRVRTVAFLTGAATATAAALAIAGWMLWTAPRPDTTLRATDASPSDQVLRLTDYARRELVMKSTLTAYEPVLGLEVWSARSRLGNDCLLVFEPVSDDLLAVACVPPPAQPLVEIHDVPVAWTQKWTEQFPTGTAVRFVQVGDAVEVWIYEGPEGSVPGGI